MTPCQNGTPIHRTTMHFHGLLHDFTLTEKAEKASAVKEKKQEDPPAAPAAEPAEKAPEPVKEVVVKEPEVEEPVAKAPEKKIKLKIVSPLKGAPKVKCLRTNI